MKEILSENILFFTSLFTIIYIAILCSIYYRFYSKKKSESYSFIKRLLVLVFFIGFILYFIGYGLEHEGCYISNFFLALYSSVRLFVLGNDLIEIKKIFHHGENSLLLFLFSLVMATVAFIFVAIFFNLFIRESKARRKIRKNNLTDANYIFLGINNAAFALASDLLTNNPSRLVIFVQNSKKQEDLLLFHKISKLGGVIISKESFFDKLSIKNEEFLINMHENSAIENAISFYENDFLKVHKLLDCIEKKETNFFILSELEERNTYAAQSIISEIQSNNIKQSISIYIRTITQPYLEEHFLCQQKMPDTIKIQFINDSIIAAQKLTLNNPPVDFIEPNTSLGIARHDFKPLVIGFGQIGQATLRKLIEMGQFVGSEFESLIIDQYMNKIEGRFCFNYPGLKKNYKLNFTEVPLGHTEFYELIEKNSDHLMYVVVSLGNDTLNMQTAQEIKCLAKRLNKEYKIFVHLNDDECFQHLLKENDNIVSFGRDFEIFSESNIIRKEIETEAKLNHKFYETANDPDRKVKQPWNKISLMKQISNISAMEHQQTKLKLAGLTEAEVCNCKSEEEFLQKFSDECFENLSKTEHLRWNANYFVYGWDTWNLEEITGEYSSNEEKKLHACLVDWDTLDKVSDRFYDFKKYDRIIVKKIYQQVINKHERTRKV